MALALALTGLACAKKSGTAPAPAPTVAKPESEIRIAVTNRYSLSAEIFAVAAGIKLRLGTVHPNTTSTFVLPRSVTGNGKIAFSAEITDERPVVSDEFLLVEGDVVEFEIGMHLIGSTSRVRPRQ